MATLLDLQDELVKDVGRILRTCTYRSPSGGLVPMNIYAQNIPVRDTDDAEDPVPYTIVRLNSGGDSGQKDSDNLVSVVIIIVTWDDSLNDQGYRDVINTITRIYERFHKNPNLNRVAWYTGEFNWAMQEDAYYPYSIGACSLNFRITAIRREDPFA